MENDFWAKSQMLCKFCIPRLLSYLECGVSGGLMYEWAACMCYVHLCMLKTFCPLYQANTHNSVMHRLHCISTSYSDLKLHWMPWYWQSAKHFVPYFYHQLFSPACEKKNESLHSAIGRCTNANQIESFLVRYLNNDFIDWSTCLAQCARFYYIALVLILVNSKLRWP